MLGRAGGSCLRRESPLNSEPGGPVPLPFSPLLGSFTREGVAECPGARSRAPTSGPRRLAAARGLSGCPDPSGWVGGPARGTGRLLGPAAGARSPARVGPRRPEAASPAQPTPAAILGPDGSHGLPLFTSPR